MKFTWISAAMAAALMMPVAGAAQAGPKGQAETSTRDAASVRGLTGGTCSNMTEISFKADDDPTGSTNSAVFVDIPGAGLTFTQGGDSNGCVVVTYSAESFADDDRLLRVRARLDNSKVAVPGAVQFSGDDDEDEDGSWSRSHSFTFIFPSVAPGQHTLKMQFRSAVFGQRVYIQKQSTVVQHQ